MIDYEIDVAIIGAGAAGLAAARTLARRGVRCALFEANGFVGGRMRTLSIPSWPMPVELGAEFVHAHPAPTLALTSSKALHKVPDVRAWVGPSVRPMPNVWSRFQTLLEPALQASSSDTVRDYLASGPFAGEPERLVRSLVEGYHAAPIDEVSALSVARDARGMQDFEQFRVEQGQAGLLEGLLFEVGRREVPIELGVHVQRLSWRRGQVTIHAQAQERPLTIRARRCILTVSVGVLQAAVERGGIAIEPYPAQLRAHLPRLGMGHVVKLVLRFATPQWPEVGPASEATFLHAPDGAFKTFWRQTSGEAEQITAWAGGPAATALAEQHPALVEEQALIEIARVCERSLGTCRKDLLEIHHHDFVGDPHCLGAYSFVRPNGQGAARALSEPIEQTLFFAGEALDLQFPATVAGAIGSGTHCARKLIRATYE